MDFDWDDLDDNGDPKPLKHRCPFSLRRGWHFFQAVYVDVFFVWVHGLPNCTQCFLTTLRVVPFLIFLAVLGWTGMSLWTNYQYQEGSCVVAQLPPQYDNVGGQSNLVSGVYTVRRTLPSTVTQTESYMLQTCEVRVPCDRMDYGQNGWPDDDRCVAFDSWKWRDKVRCFHRKDDLRGELGTELFCPNLPNDMQREFFSVVVASGQLLLFMIVNILVYARTRQETERDEAEIDFENDKAEEEAEAKRIIEERDKRDCEEGVVQESSSSSSSEESD